MIKIQTYYFNAKNEPTLSDKILIRKTDIKSVTPIVKVDGDQYSRLSMDDNKTSYTVKYSVDAFQEMFFRFN